MRNSLRNRQDITGDDGCCCDASNDVTRRQPDYRVRYLPNAEPAKD